MEPGLRWVAHRPLSISFSLLGHRFMQYILNYRLAEYATRIYILELLRAALQGEFCCGVSPFSFALFFYILWSSGKYPFISAYTSFFLPLFWGV